MNVRLLISAAVKLFCGLACIALMLFLPAGTMDFPNAWLLLGVLFVPMLLAGLILWIKQPELLRKRLDSREKQDEQKLVVLLSLLMFVFSFVVAGLDFRLGWSKLPAWLNSAAAVVFLAGYGMYGEVLRENAFLSRTIQVQSGQRVVDTGLYGLVRHPMYTATILMFLSMPLVLGSIPAFVILLCYPLLIARRIANEEAVLKAGLEGYIAYTEKVKYRLLPFIW